MPRAEPYHRPFDEQVAFFKAKLNLPTERWDDIKHEEHDRAFIVAGAQGADLLADFKDAVTRAIRDGTGLDAFRKDFREIVKRNGWTGWTGEGSKAGEAWRTKVIYQTNMATSYAAGRYQQLTDPELLSILPYWRYKHADGVMYPRPLHVSWDGLTLPPDHPFWRTHYPPNGWGCHCRVSAASRRDFQEAISRGKGPANAPAADDIEGIDKGFAYAPGASVSEELKRLVDGKVAKLPAPIGQAFAQDAAIVLAIDNDRLRSALDAAASRIVTADVEHLLVVDVLGKQLLHKTGTEHAVNLSEHELSLLPGQIMLHNHAGTPQSFSVDDVRLAIWHNLSEMHVVDQLYLYVLRRSPGVEWGPKMWQQVEAIWSSIEPDVTRRLNEALAQGLIERDQYDVLLEHMIWTEVDGRVTIGYSRLPRNSP